MYFDGAQGVGQAKSAGFDYSFSTTDQEDLKKSKFDNFPGGLFTVPNPNSSVTVAFNVGDGGRGDGAFNA